MTRTDVRFVTTISIDVKLYPQHQEFKLAYKKLDRLIFFYYNVVIKVFFVGLGLNLNFYQAKGEENGKP